MISLGIDPGTTDTAFVVVDKGGALLYRETLKIKHGIGAIPRIVKSTIVIAKIQHVVVAGSDSWGYRGPFPPKHNMAQEELRNELSAALARVHVPLIFVVANFVRGVYSDATLKSMGLGAALRNKHERDAARHALWAQQQMRMKVRA